MPDGFMKEKNLKKPKLKLLPLKNALKLQNEHRVARKTTLYGDFFLQNKKPTGINKILIIIIFHYALGPTFLV